MVFQHLAAQAALQDARGKVYACFGYFSPTDLTYYINRMKFILCYWVSPAPSPSSRETNIIQKDEVGGEAICLLQSALPFAAQNL